MACVTSVLVYYGLPDVASSDKHTVCLLFVASRLPVPHNIVFLYAVKLAFLSA